MVKSILCLDFDGVCHSYTSGWQGSDVILDPPVDGLFEFLKRASEVFDIHIYSSRSHQSDGIKAMIGWFLHHRPVVEEWQDYSVSESSIVWWGVRLTLHFPQQKPPAQVTIDDRAICFDGTWPDLQMLKDFKPWNKL